MCVCVCVCVYCVCVCVCVCVCWVAGRVRKERTRMQGAVRNRRGEKHHVCVWGRGWEAGIFVAIT